MTTLVAAGCSGGSASGPARHAARPATTTSTTTEPVHGTPGAVDAGDPVTPGVGNGGFDIGHYDLTFDTSAGDGSMVATAVIDATATQDLSAFDLDLRGFTVDSVSIASPQATSKSGSTKSDATFTRVGDELVLAPARAIARGGAFTTTVRYHGTPGGVIDPTAPGRIGWLTGQSGSFVAAEPIGATGIYPCSDHPSDKATYDIHVVAPSAATVAANGVQTEHRVTGATTRWSFSMPEPMATYLVQVAIGDYDVITATGPHGLPLRSLVARHLPASRRATLASIGDQISYFETLFGPYPFATYGVLVADSPPQYALETQTLSLFPVSWFEGDSGTDLTTVEAHELAHQWFGDAVTPARWSDIWLNEGFATYAEWLWDDHAGIDPLQRSVDTAMRSAPSWRRNFGAVIHPNRAAGLFSPNEYDGAAIVLAALRRTIGDGPFFTLLQRWVTDHEGASVTTADFEAEAAAVSGRDLGSFFDAWLNSSTVPPFPS